MLSCQILALHVSTPILSQFGQVQLVRSVLRGQLVISLQVYIYIPISLYHTIKLYLFTIYINQATFYTIFYSEYGGGGPVSTSGDVYSFGVFLEILTGKRPTDPMFTGELDIISFVKNNFPHQIFHIIDSHLVEECEHLIQDNKVTNDEMYPCLVALLQVALSCTRSSPSQRSNMKEVARKLHAIRTSQIG